MARQAEAERERRAKVIDAEGEVQAARSWPRRPRSSAHPGALQLRYLQTLVESRRRPELDDRVPSPPIDLVKPFLERAAGADAPEGVRTAPLVPPGTAC